MPSAVTSTPARTPYPTAPHPSMEDDEFNEATADFVAAMEARAAEQQAIAEASEANAAVAEDSAALAVAAAAAGESAAAVALASANFKGTWASLAGALAKPASVLHSGSYWMLLTNLANVAASTPSVGNADWAMIYKVNQPVGDVVGTTDAQILTNKTLDKPVVTEYVVTAGASMAVAVSRYYVITAAAVTLTLPAAPADGDWVHIVNASGAVNCVVARNSNKIMSLAEDMTINVVNAPIRLIYIDTTRGWVLG